MVTASELRNIPVFADLPDDQMACFISQSQEHFYKPDEVYMRQGDPADAMFVILEGHLQVRGEIGGETISLTTKAGDVTGVLPFSRMKQVPVTGRSITNSRILRFPAAQFPELVQKMPELAKRLVGLMSYRIREVTRIEQQRDRLAALGELSAGLAHALNSPTSAARRATRQPRKILKKIKDASGGTGKSDLPPAPKHDVEKMDR